MHEIVLIGNLGSDPEMRYTPSGQSVTSFSVASNRRWRDRDGEMQEVTDWFRVSVWGNQAEAANNYLEKGRQVYVRGREEIREFEDRNGDIRFSREINAFDLQFLGGGQGGGDSRDNRDNRGDNRGSGQQQGNRNSGGGNRQQGGGSRQSGGGGNRQNQNQGNRQNQNNSGGRNQGRQQQDNQDDDWDNVDDTPF